MYLDGQYHSATSLMSRIHARTLRPGTLTEAALARMDTINPTLNAVCTSAAEQARAAAADADRLWRTSATLPPLLGLPVGIKDVTATAGLRTTYGSPLCRDHVPAQDAEIVRRLKAAGAIVLGKTNTPEFAAGANTVNPVFGATRNPWQPALSAGGSTGGGAAALASGMIALAQGTDLGGSLRVPAAFCGLLGLRPTPGLIPTSPEPAPWDTLQVDGLITRTAADQWLALQAVAGSCNAASVSTPAPVAGPPALDTQKRGRLAWIADLAGVGMDPMIAAACQETVTALQGDGWQIDTLTLDLSHARDTFLVLRGATLVSQLMPWLDARAQMGENLRNNLEYGLRLTSRQIAEAQHQRLALRHRLLTLLAPYDALLTPCTPVSPFAVEQNFPGTIAGRPMATYIDWVAPTFLLSLAALPVASVPAGLTPEGLPVGMQVVGRPWEEFRVLSVATAIERARPLPTPELNK